MKFRPCIDIHNGKVKQIVGSSLRDSGDAAKDNFVSEHSSEYFADIYKEKKLENSHVIILNSADSEFYEASKKAAMAAGFSKAGAFKPLGHAATRLRFFKP